MIVTIQDARKHLGYCSPGMRRFAKKYELDWMDFLRNGISEEKLLATGDSLALNLVAAVKLERAGDGLKQEDNDRIQILHGDSRSPLSGSGRQD